jgi:translation initiation factor IF-2
VGGGGVPPVPGPQEAVGARPHSPAQQAGGRSDSSSEGGPSEARTLAEVKCGRPGAGRTHMGPTPRRGAFGLGRSRREARDPLGTGSGPRARSLQNGGGGGGGARERASGPAGERADGGGAGARPGGGATGGGTEWRPRSRVCLVESRWGNVLRRPRDRAGCAK